MVSTVLTTSKKCVPTNLFLVAGLCCLGPEPVNNTVSSNIIAIQYDCESFERVGVKSLKTDASNYVNILAFSYPKLG